MEGKAYIDARREPRAVRIAWLVTLVVPLVLIALLLAVKPSPAATFEVPRPAALAFEEGEEEGEEGPELERDECEEAEAEFAEGELGASEVEEICEEGEEKAKGIGVAPPECLLRSANARVVAYTSRNSVRLTVGYTTYDPANAKVEIRRGSVRIGSARRHLGRSGVIRLTKKFGDPEMAKVRSADHFTVQLHIAGAPGNCRRFETKHLTVERTSRSQIVWSQTR